ncbi:MAG: hypothetical protein JSR54_00860 [Proteobacteria bacterium]|nr:hypothetical protein [Pseudomonadota bacterium]
MSDDGAELAAATALARARFDDRLPCLPGGWVPANMEAAYGVQKRVRALRGQGIAAYKIGMTNAAAQQANGLAEPIVGWLDSASVLPDGAALAGAAARKRWVESEVIFRMAADVRELRPEGAIEAVAQAIGSAHAGIEVCDSRFVDTDAQPAVNIVADNSNASVIVIGAALPRLPPPLEVTLTCGSAPPVTGCTSAVLGDPLGSLCWLARWLQQRGETLRAGQFIATGTCTGIIEAGPDDRCEARFGDLASVECHFLP